MLLLLLLWYNSPRVLFPMLNLSESVSYVDIYFVFPQNVKKVCECLLKLMTLGNVVRAVMNVVLT